MARWGCLRGVTSSLEGEMGEAHPRDTRQGWACALKFLPRPRLLGRDRKGNQLPTGSGLSGWYRRYFEFSGDCNPTCGAFPFFQCFQRGDRLIKMATLPLQFRDEFPDIQCRLPPPLRIERFNSGSWGRGRISSVCSVFGTTRDAVTFHSVRRSGDWTRRKRHSPRPACGRAGVPLY